MKIRYALDRGAEMVRSLMILNPLAAAFHSLQPHPWMPTDGGFPNAMPTAAFSPA